MMLLLVALTAVMVIVLHLEAEVVALKVLIRTIRFPYLVPFDHSHLLFVLLLLQLLLIQSNCIIFAVSVQLHSLQAICLDQSCQV